MGLEKTMAKIVGLALDGETPKETLYRLYYTEMRNTSELCLHLNVHHYFLSAAMLKLGVPKRPRGGKHGTGRDRSAEPNALVKKTHRKHPKQKKFWNKCIGGCDKHFWGESKFNRICTECAEGKSDVEWQEPSRAFGVAAYIWLR